ncbi:putative Glutamate receptor ionotropic, kainate 1-like 5, partial [Homarus americanus]
VLSGCLQKDGGRLIVTTWLLASLVFMTSYGGILTAMLTCLGSPSHRLLADLESPDELHQKVHRGQGPNIKACLNRRQNIADGKLAAICDDTTMMKAMADDFSKDYGYSETGECHLYITREKVLSHAIMARLHKHSSTSPRPTIVVLEAGLWNKWLETNWLTLHAASATLSWTVARGLQPIDMDSFIGLSSYSSARHFLLNYSATAHCMAPHHTSHR